MARKHAIFFRDERGRFLAQSERYTDKVAQIQAWRAGEYVTIAERPLEPQMLASVLSQREFESLSEALIEVKDFESSKKYKAWDISEQIDRTKGIRRRNLKVTMVLDDGGRKRTVEFYHHIKRNAASSYSIFRRINQEIGLEGFYLYKEAGGKILADRKGKQVKLVSVKVQKVV